MTWINPNQTPLERGEYPDTAGTELLNRKLEDLTEAERFNVLPSLDRVAGSRPLSNILVPGEESMQIIRVRDYITNGATASENGLAGTEKLIDSVIPANYLIISSPSVIALNSLILFVSLDNSIKVNSSSAASFHMPDNVDFALTANPSVNWYGIQHPQFSIPLPRKRHLISYCWGLGAVNFGSDAYASFIFLNLERR